MLVHLIGIIRQLTAVAMVAILAGCATVPGMPSGAKEETVFLDHQDQFGRPIKLEVLLFLPEGNGPFDVVLYSHGAQSRDNPREVYKNYNVLVLEPFLKRGVAVVMPIRQGRGNSGGEPASLSCNLQSSLYGFTQDYGDVLAGLRYIQSSPLFAGRKVYAVGHSRGGYLSAALAANRPTEIGAAVGFGSGWQSVGRSNSCRNGQFLHTEYMERLAAPSAAKTLFVYDESDNFHPPASNQEAFARYWAKGGKGELKVYSSSFADRPSNWSDGHYVMTFTSKQDRNERIWEKDVMKFLGIDK